MTGKIIGEFINSCTALRHPHWRLWKKHPNQTINPIICPHFSREDCPFCVLVFCVLKIDVKITNNELLMLFSLLICLLKTSYPEKFVSPDL